eukprot:Amastigsp_a342597_31.p5 type:complete len:131 gc:universal Amastigsp_a342597_31:896-504(-)
MPRGARRLSLLTTRDRARPALRRPRPHRRPSAKPRRKPRRPTSAGSRSRATALGICLAPSRRSSSIPCGQSPGGASRTSNSTTPRLRSSLISCSRRTSWHASRARGIGASACGISTKAAAGTTASGTAAR